MRHRAAEHAPRVSDPPRGGDGYRPAQPRAHDDVRDRAVGRGRFGRPASACADVARSPRNADVVPAAERDSRERARGHGLRASRVRRVGRAATDALREGRDALPRRGRPAADPRRAPRGGADPTRARGVRRPGPARTRVWHLRRVSPHGGRGARARDRATLRVRRRARATGSARRFARGPGSRRPPHPAPRDLRPLRGDVPGDRPAPDPRRDRRGRPHRGASHGPRLALRHSEPRPRRSRARGSARCRSTTPRWGGDAGSRSR